MSRAAAHEALRELGFNQLEAEVYVHLLAKPGLTAYAVGKAIGRPTANVYKAVESLSRRGAVLVEEGGQRVCRAVPVSEFLEQLHRGFRSSLQTLKDVLEELEVQPDDERVYRVESVARLFERCREMLARCKQVAVVDAFPRALERLAPWIESACARGVEVYVEAYAPVTLKGARVVVFPRGEETLKAWRGEQLNLVVDGREHALAFLSPDLTEVRQAVWSNSLYLSCLHHAGRLSEHTLIGALALEQQGKSARGLIEGHGFFASTAVPGHLELMKRFAPVARRSRR